MKNIIFSIFLLGLSTAYAEGIDFDEIQTRLLTERLSPAERIEMIKSPLSEEHTGDERAIYLAQVVHALESFKFSVAENDELAETALVELLKFPYKKSVVGRGTTAESLARSLTEVSVEAKVVSDSFAKKYFSTVLKSPATTEEMLETIVMFYGYWSNPQLSYPHFVSRVTAVMEHPHFDDEVAEKTRENLTNNSHSSKRFPAKDVALLLERLVASGKLSAGPLEHAKKQRDSYAVRAELESYRHKKINISVVAMELIRRHGARSVHAIAEWAKNNSPQAYGTVVDFLASTLEPMDPREFIASEWHTIAQLPLELELSKSTQEKLFVKDIQIAGTSDGYVGFTYSLIYVNKKKLDGVQFALEYLAEVSPKAPPFDPMDPNNPNGDDTIEAVLDGLASCSTDEAKSLCQSVSSADAIYRKIVANQNIREDLREKAASLLGK